MTLNLLLEARAQIFQMPFEVTRIYNDLTEANQFLFLTLKQLSPNEQLESFYILSIDDKGYLNLKKILLNIPQSSKALKWYLSNDELNLNDISNFNVSLKLSKQFIELNLNNKHTTRYELINDQLDTQFEIEQIKFSNNFILNNSVSFLISRLSIIEQNYEFSDSEDVLNN